MSRWARYRNGYSRSANAEAAEVEGRLPLTRAIPVVAKVAGVTRAKAREALLAVHDGEWHHVGKYANKVQYYDTAMAVAWLQLPSLLADEDMRFRIGAAFHSLIEHEFYELKQFAFRHAQTRLPSYPWMAGLLPAPQQEIAHAM